MYIEARNFLYFNYQEIAKIHYVSDIATYKDIIVTIV